MIKWLGRLLAAEIARIQECEKSQSRAEVARLIKELGTANAHMRAAEERVSELEAELVAKENEPCPFCEAMKVQTLKAERAMVDHKRVVAELKATQDTLRECQNAVRHGAELKRMNTRLDNARGTLEKLLATFPQLRQQFHDLEQYARPLMEKQENL